MTAAAFVVALCFAGEWAVGDPGACPLGALAFAALGVFGLVLDRADKGVA